MKDAADGLRSKSNASTDEIADIQGWTQTSVLGSFLVY